MFLLDANVFIEAKNRYYAMDLVPAFWSWLEHAGSSGTIGSIAAVRDELVEGDDRLAGWAKEHKEFFRGIDSASVPYIRELSEWSNSRDYTPAAVAEFASDRADLLLIASARAHNDVVVTLERPQPNARRRILIPDACEAVGARWSDTFTMMRQTHTRFTVWESDRPLPEDTGRLF